MAHLFKCSSSTGLSYMQFIWILCFVAVIFACVADVFCTLI